MVYRESFKVQSRDRAYTFHDVTAKANKEERDQWRDDVACTDARMAGDQVWPTRKGGTPDIAPEVYEKMRQMWEEEKNAEGGYTQRSFKQGSGK